MSQPMQFQLDHDGIETLLKSDAVATVVNDLAGQIAENARDLIDDDTVTVEVDPYDTDRHVASVAIKHPGGRGMQLKRGVLTRAAGMVGLEVRSK